MTTRMTTQKKSPRLQAGAEKVIHKNYSTLNQQEIQVPLHNSPTFLRAMEKIHAQGPRAIAELVQELAITFDRPHATAYLVKRYADLPEGLLKQLGVENLPYHQPLSVPHDR